MCRLLSAFVSFAMLLGGVIADDAKSGLTAGAYLPGPFQVYAVTGTHANRPHCLVCEHGLHPVVTVFARDMAGADSPVVKLLQALEASVEKNKASNLAAFAVVLSDEAQNIDSRRALAKKLQDLADAAKLKNVVLALDSAAGPKGYDLSKEAGVTVVLYHKHKIVGVHSFPRDGLNDAGIKTILDDVEKMMPAGKKK